MPGWCSGRCAKERGNKAMNDSDKKKLTLVVDFAVECRCPGCNASFADVEMEQEVHGVFVGSFSCMAVPESGVAIAYNLCRICADRVANSSRKWKKALEDEIEKCLLAWWQASGSRLTSNGER